MSQMQRYCMQYDGFEECVIEEAYDRGAWVKASDAEAALAEKDKEIARLRRGLGRIKAYTNITWIKDVCKEALEGVG